MNCNFNFNACGRKTKRNGSCSKPKEQTFEATCTFRGGEKRIRILGEKFFTRNMGDIKLFLDGYEIPPTDILERSNNRFYHLKVVIKKERISDLSFLFDSCRNYLKISLAGDADSIQNISSMFYKCISLSVLEGFKNFDWSYLIFANEVFYGCASLTFIPGIEKIRLHSIPSFGMFKGCASLVWLNTDIRYCSYDATHDCPSLLNCVYKVD